LIYELGVHFVSTKSLPASAYESNSRMFALKCRIFKVNKAAKNY
jgi:hypothetical protein